MKDHFRKPFGFLALMNPTRPRSRGSTSIACPKDAIQKGCQSRLRNRGEGALNKQTHFAKNTVPRGQKSQSVIRDRKVSESEPLSGHRYNFSPVFRNSSATFDRTKEVNNLNKSVVIEDFANKIWSPLQKSNIYSETSVQDGYLTTTLCSTEL